MFGWLRRPEAPAAPLRAVEVAVAPAAGPVPARRAEAVLRRVEWTVLRRLDVHDPRVAEAVSEQAGELSAGS